MAFSVVQMGKKLGLVGTPRIRVAAANIRRDLCQRNRHLTTNVEGLSDGETDYSGFYSGLTWLTLGIGGMAYIEYKEPEREAREAEAQRKLEDAYRKYFDAELEDVYRKAALERRLKKD